METPGRPQQMMRFAGMATQWMVLLLIAVWGGLKTDQWLWHGKAPVFIILFPLIALVVSFRNLIKELDKPKK